MLALGLLGPVAVAGCARVPESADHWAVLAAILQHMLPGGGGVPSAAEVHAIDYLRATLEHPLADHAWRARILDGAKRVQRAAQSGHGQSFTALNAAAREQVLRQIEDEPGGQTFLSKLLDFLFEGLLADPIYGGNFEERGWRGLQHTPGFPRPPADKLWYRLLPMRESRVKSL